VALSVVEDNLSESIDVLFDESEGSRREIEVSLSLGVLLLEGRVLRLAFASKFDVLSFLDLDGSGVIGDSALVVGHDLFVVVDVVGEFVDVGAKVSDVLGGGVNNLVVVLNAFFLSLVFDVLGVLEFVNDLLDHGDDLVGGGGVGLDRWGLDELSNVGDNGDVSTAGISWLGDFEGHLLDI